jgi:hypothetical protein
MRVWISRISTSATGDIAQIVNDRLGISASSGETDVAIRADQDQRVTRDAVGVGGVSIALDQGMVSDRGRAPCTRDGVGAQDISLLKNSKQKCSNLFCLCQSAPFFFGKDENS